MFADIQQFVQLKETLRSAKESDSARLSLQHEDFARVVRRGKRDGPLKDDCGPV